MQSMGVCTAKRCLYNKDTRARCIHTWISHRCSHVKTDGFQKTAYFAFLARFTPKRVNTSLNVKTTEIFKRRAKKRHIRRALPNTVAKQGTGTVTNTQEYARQMMPSRITSMYFMYYII